MKLNTYSMAMPLLLALLAGCRMCQSPFDYCGPVVHGDGCPDCDFGARRGSAFAPTADSPPENLIPKSDRRPGSDGTFSQPDEPRGGTPSDSYR